jgi:hypothetical protein
MAHLVEPRLGGGPVSVHECVTPDGDPYLAIDMQESWTECIVCGAETPARRGLPAWNGMIVANDWPGEWGAVPACEPCWGRHERGELVEVPTSEFYELGLEERCGNFTR